jgi:outer membrane biosynthesis protein TonB
MKFRRAILMGTLLAAALTLPGCKKKKPAVPPPQATAPTITEPETAPAPETTKPQPEVAPPAVPPQPTAEKPKPRPRPKPRTKITKKEPVKPAPKPAEKPAHTVVSEGGTQPAPGSQLSIPADSTTQQKLNTAQLLDATDRNLRSITRQLSPDEQRTIEHIRSFVAQSRQATLDGDTERAYTLALKAHLLSDEIVKK